MLSLRPMTEADLPAVEAWLRLQANAASRRVLERNGFRLVAVKPVATEATDAPMAIYRLPPAR